MRSLFEDHGSQGAFEPFLVGDGDHGGLGDGGVGHEGVLQLDGGDPLAARLYEVLGAVFISIYPRPSMVAMSPVLSQPSSVNFSSDSGES